MRHKINIVFEQLSLQKFAIKSIIRTCVNAVLDAEGINVPCEINVLVTDDAGIQVVNRESRHMDKPTDVLSFPMFQLIAGEPPTDWTDFQDPETGLVPLGDMCISLERAIAQQTADEAFKKGVEMTMTQLTGIFEKLGVTAFGEAGEAFDPTLHNAVMHAEDESAGENVILEVFQKGFRIGEKVVRFAMVKVAN